MHIPEAGEGAGRCWDQSGAIYQPLHPGMAFEAGGQRRSALRVGEGGGVRVGMGWGTALPGVPLPQGWRDPCACPLSCPPVRCNWFSNPEPSLSSPARLGEGSRDFCASPPPRPQLPRLLARFPSPALCCAPAAAHFGVQSVFPCDTAAFPGWI